MSLMTLRDSSIVVAVLSNFAHANTPALGLKIEDAFETGAMRHMSRADSAFSCPSASSSSGTRI